MSVSRHKVGQFCNLGRSGKGCVCSLGMVGNRVNFKITAQTPERLHSPTAWRARIGLENPMFGSSLAAEPVLILLVRKAHVVQ